MRTKVDHYHVSPLIDIMRMILGVILIIMGIRFGANPHDVFYVIGGSTGFLSLFIVHYIVMCHVVGGILLVLGLITRVAAIVQLPVLVGALILTSANGYGSIYTSFWFTLVVLIMLLAVSYYGSGRYSLDAAMKERKQLTR
jgi:putative oxidoreductase